MSGVNKKKKEVEVQLHTIFRKIIAEHVLATPGKIT